jgi:oxygen-independent coproporphyrinogen-3 oxidase
VLSAAGYQASCGKTTWSRIPGDVGTSSYLARRVTDGMPYLGIGLGAQTLSPTCISYNDGAATKSLVPYRRSVEAGRLPLQDVYDLPLEHCVGKMAAVSFYFGEIDEAAFRRRFGRSIAEHFPRETEFVVMRGLMEWSGRSLRLTPDGCDHVNGVIALFHAPSIQSVLLAGGPDLSRARRAAVAVAGGPA